MASTKVGYLHKQTHTHTHTDHKQLESLPDIPHPLPLLHNAVQGVHWFVIVQLVGLDLLPLVQSLLYLLDEGPKVSELLQQWLMGQELNVLYVVVCLVGSAPMVDLLLVLWLMGVDAF